MAKYQLIYDGNCNLCVTFTKLLESFERGEIFNYIPMQNTEFLTSWGVTTADCEQGMMVLSVDQKWQGSEAVEKIVELLPNGALFLNAYRAVPALKQLGDTSYLKVRDNRYQWFGSTDSTYYSPNCQCN